MLVLVKAHLNIIWLCNNEHNGLWTQLFMHAQPESVLCANINLERSLLSIKSQPGYWPEQSD